MSKLFVIWAIPALCLAGAVAAQDKPREWTSACKPEDNCVFSFRGQRIGDPIEGTDDYTRNRRDCAGDGWTEGYLACADHRVNLGPALRYKTLIWKYLDGRLIGFVLQMQGADYPRLRLMVKARYGRPYHEEQPPGADETEGLPDANAAGWMTPHGLMRLGRASGDAWLTLTDAKARIEIAQRRLKTAATDAKTAF